MLTKIDGLILAFSANFPHLEWTMKLTGETCALLLLLSFASLTALERGRPKIRRPASQTRRSYSTNIAMFVLNSALISLCSIAPLYWVAEHFSGLGLLNHVSEPVLRGLLGFLVIDLLLYGWHVLCHKWDVLWLFHRVHHNDPYVNVSTAFRLHLAEMLITHLLKALVIVLMGIDKALVLVIETVITFSVMFHHANIRLPWEPFLGRLIIVPYLHRVHHSKERFEHDSNYGAVLSLWDWLFGTLLDCEVSGVGIKGRSPQDLFGLFKFGFGLGGKTPMPAPATVPAGCAPELESMIAVAAYYRAEKRNFAPGDELRDWYEAKSDLMAQCHPARQQQLQSSRSQPKRFKLIPSFKAQQFNSRPA